MEDTYGDILSKIVEVNDHNLRILVKIMKLDKYIEI